MCTVYTYCEYVYWMRENVTDNVVHIMSLLSGQNHGYKGSFLYNIDDIFNMSCKIHAIPQIKALNCNKQHGLQIVK